MSTILDTILRRKHEEVAERRERVSLFELKTRAASAPPVRGFAEGLRTGGAAFTFAHGNLFESCDHGLVAPRQSRVIGTNLASNVRVLVRAGPGAVVDKQIFVTEPDVLLERGGAGFDGAAAASAREGGEQYRSAGRGGGEEEGEAGGDAARAVGGGLEQGEGGEKECDGGEGGNGDEDNTIQ